MSFLDRINQTFHSTLVSAENSIQETFHDAVSNASETIDSFSHNLNSLAGEYRYFYSGVWREGASSGQRIVGNILGATTIAGAAAGVGLAVYAAAITAVGAGVLKGLTYGGAVLIAGVGLSGCGPGGGEVLTLLVNGSQRLLSRMTDRNNFNFTGCVTENMNQIVSLDNQLLGRSNFNIVTGRQYEGSVACVQDIYRINLLPNVEIDRSNSENYLITDYSRAYLSQFVRFLNQRSINHLSIRQRGECNSREDRSREQQAIVRFFRDSGYTGELTFESDPYLFESNHRSLSICYSR